MSDDRWWYYTMWQDSTQQSRQKPSTIVFVLTLILAIISLGMLGLLVAALFWYFS